MTRRALGGASLLFVLSVVVGALAGPARVPSEAWIGALRGESGPWTTIILAVRLPRVLAALLTGGALAVSGAVFQALLRNPLAEPYLLGVSSGAALGAVIALGLGVSASAHLLLPAAALGGALLAIALVFRAGRVRDRLDTRILLLAGVVVSAFFAACVLLVLTFVPQSTLRTAFFWTMGSLSGASWGMIAGIAAYVLPATLAIFAMSRHLDALSLGEETAAFLGTDPERIKRVAYILASLLAAAAVAMAGVIGFIGLVMPHAIRLSGARDHRTLVPAAFIGGGGALVLADAAARTIAAPMEIPVGVITAFLGVPFFLVLLRRSYAP